MDLYADVVYDAVVNDVFNDSIYGEVHFRVIVFDRIENGFIDGITQISNDNADSVAVGLDICYIGLDSIIVITDTCSVSVSFCLFL